MTKAIPEVRRRGRPPLAAKPVAEPKPTIRELAGAPPLDDFSAEPTAAPSKRRRRASVGGHAMKLTAPPRPGHSRRWFNDQNNRIATAQELGYDHVTEQGIETHDPSSRVSRIVGTKANGEPLRAYLMETPDELYAEGVAEKEAHNAEVDQAIRAGQDSTGQHQSDGYVGQGSITRDR